MRQCSRCRRAWCPACVRTSTASGKPIEYCTKCKGTLHAPSVSVAHPALDLADLIARPFSVEGLLTAAAIAFGAWLSWMPGLGRLFAVAATAALVGYYFQIIDHVGSDKPGLPGPSDDVEGPLKWLAKCGRGLLCVLVGAAPALIWFYGYRDPAAPPTTNALITIGLTVVGMSYMPAALLTVVLTGSTLGVLYPVAWVKIIARAPASYLKLVLLFMLSAVAYLLTMMFSTVFSLLIPFVGSLLVGTVTNLMLFVQACLVGGFLRRHADLFGWDSPR